MNDDDIDFSKPLVPRRLHYDSCEDCRRAGRHGIVRLDREDYDRSQCAFRESCVRVKR